MLHHLHKFCQFSDVMLEGHAIVLIKSDVLMQDANICVFCFDIGDIFKVSSDEKGTTKDNIVKNMLALCAGDAPVCRLSI